MFRLRLQVEEVEYCISKNFIRVLNAPIAIVASAKMIHDYYFKLSDKIPKNEGSRLATSNNGVIEDISSSKEAQQESWLLNISTKCIIRNFIGKIIVY